MPMYKVTYSSMSAHYGPSFIQADSEWEAKRKFAGTAFHQGEMNMIHAREISSSEIASALRDRECRDDD